MWTPPPLPRHIAVLATTIAFRVAPPLAGQPQTRFGDVALAPPNCADASANRPKRFRFWMVFRNFQHFSNFSKLKILAVNYLP